MSIGTPASYLSAPSPTSSTSTSFKISAPRRGGDHHLYGIYLGGSELTDDYELDGTHTYKYTAQRCHPKAIGSLEQALTDARDSTTTNSKFNGKLEVDKTGSTRSEPEVDKAEFIKLLKDKVRHYGQQSFYVLINC